MTYPVHLTDSLLTDVPFKQVGPRVLVPLFGTDARTSPFVLIGKERVDFGERLNENLVRMIENFARPTAPSDPLEGMLWWAKTDGLLQVFDGAGWQTLVTSANLSDELSKNREFVVVTRAPNQAALDGDGILRLTRAPSGNDTARIEFRSQTSASPVILRQQGSGLSITSNLTVAGSLTTASVRADLYSFTDDAGTALTRPSPDTIGFRTANAQRMTLSDAGALRVQSSGAASIELTPDGGIEVFRSSGPFIDFKLTEGEDFRARIQAVGNDLHIAIPPGGDVRINGFRVLHEGNAGTLSLSGDLTGSGTLLSGTIAATLPTIIVPGTFTQVTVDSKGRVTAGLFTQMISDNGTLLNTTVSPVGVIQSFTGSLAPGGWLMCFGQAVSRTQYAALFAVIGTTFGSGDGSTTFNLPDLRGRAVVGLDNMGGTTAGRLGFATTIGAAAGSQTHVLTLNELPSHTHTGTTDVQGNHAHSGTTDGAGAHNHFGLTVPQRIVDVDRGTQGGGSIFSLDNEVNLPWEEAHSHPFSTSVAGSHTHNLSISSAGLGQAHNNVQPSFVLNFIIRWEPATIATSPNAISAVEMQADRYVFRSDTDTGMVWGSQQGLINFIGDNRRIAFMRTAPGGAIGEFVVTNTNTNASISLQHDGGIELLRRNNGEGGSPTPGGPFVDFKMDPASDFDVRIQQSSGSNAAGNRHILNVVGGLPAQLRMDVQGRLVSSAPAGAPHPTLYVRRDGAAAGGMMILDDNRFAIGRVDGNGQNVRHHMAFDANSNITYLNGVITGSSAAQATSATASFGNLPFGVVDVGRVYAATHFFFRDSNNTYDTGFCQGNDGHTSTDDGIIRVFCNNVGIGGFYAPGHPDWPEGGLYMGRTVLGNRLVSQTDVQYGGSLILSSDQRLKENILTLPDALEKVKSLRGVTYTRKSDGTPHIGLIAQEVQSVLPDQVTVTTVSEDGYLGIRGDEFTGLLIQAIKELSAKVDAQQAELQALRNRLNSAGL